MPAVPQRLSWPVWAFTAPDLPVQICLCRAWPAVSQSPSLPERRGSHKLCRAVPCHQQLPHPLSLLQPITLGDYDLALISFFPLHSWPDPSKGDASSSYTRSHALLPAGWTQSSARTGLLIISILACIREDVNRSQRAWLLRLHPSCTSQIMMS